MGAASSIRKPTSAPSTKKGKATSGRDLFEAAFSSEVVASSFLTENEILERLTTAPTKSVTIGTRECQYAALMLRGLYPDTMDKPCQDAYVIHDTTLSGIAERVRWFQVFDGHGPDGHTCAWYCRDQLDGVTKDIARKNQGMSVNDLLIKAHEETNANLHKSDAAHSQDSGTTAVSVFIVGSTLYCSNVGDSRCILGVRGSQGVVPKPLSHDQTLYRADERARVREKGGRVLSIGQIEGTSPVTDDFSCNLGEEIDQDGDPPRIWLPDRFEPGCAFSRSLGDQVAESVGCISTPEIVEHKLTEADTMCIIASDGVWEFMTNQEVIDVCLNEADPLAACHEIIAKSYKAWYEEEARIDDITLIVIYFGATSEDEGGMATSKKNSSTSAAMTRQAGEKNARHRRGSFNLPTFARLSHDHSSAQGHK